MSEALFSNEASSQFRIYGKSVSVDAVYIDVEVAGITVDNISLKEIGGDRVLEISQAQLRSLYEDGLLIPSVDVSGLSGPIWELLETAEELQHSIDDRNSVAELQKSEKEIFRAAVYNE